MKKLIILGLILVFLPSIIAMSISDSDLLAYYDLDEASGNIVDLTNKYSMSSGGDPTYQQTPLASYSDYSIDFDGAGDYFINESLDEAYGYEDVTVCAWIDNDDYGSSTQTQPFGDRYNDGSNWRGFGLKQSVESHEYQLGCFVWDDGTAKSAIVNVENAFVCCKINSTHLSSWANGIQYNSVAVSLDSGDKGANFRIGCGGSDSCSQDWNGQIDEVSIWNRSLSAEEINELYDYGIFNLNFNPPTPNDKSTNNIYENVQINASCITGTLNLYWEGQLINTYLSGQGNFTLNSSLVTTEKTYNYSGTCGNDENVTRYWTYDITDPSITINSNNFYKSDNSSRISKLNSSAYLDITLQDNNDLFAYEINMTDSKGETVYYELNNTLSGIEERINKSFSFLNFSIGNATVKFTASDSHTAQKINKYDVKEKISELEFNTEEKNNIKIVSKDWANTNAIKLKDRYSFEFDFWNKGSQERQFDIYCDGTLYRRYTDYTAHFVCSKDGISGNWIDFEGTGKNPIIKKVDDNHYIVTFDSIEDKVTFNSIGGLNTNTIYNEFEVYSNYPDNFFIDFLGDRIFNYSSIYNGTDKISLNVTKINNYLASGCNCEGCTIVGDNCRMPMLFSSDNKGILNINITNSTYKYGIDDCSNIYNIPSSATAYNITFYDQIENTRYAADFNGKINYLGNSYSFSKENQDNITFCVYPNWFNYVINGYIYYGGEGYVTKYYEWDDIYFNNDTQDLSLYLINTSNENAGNLIVEIYDEFYNYIVGANVKLLEYDSDLDSFIEVSQCYSNTNGECIFNVELNTKYYIVSATKVQDGEILTSQSTDSGELIKLDNTIIELHLTTSEEFELDDLYDLTITPSNTELIGNTSYLTAIFNDNTNRKHNVCLGYYTVSGLNEIEESLTCVNASSGVINYADGYTLNRAFTYIAKIFVIGDNGKKRVYNSYTYKALSGTFKNDFALYMANIILAIVLLLLGISLYLKNMKFFALGIIGFSPFTLYLDPSFMGGTTMVFIIVLGLLILYFTGKKTSLG